MVDAKHSAAAADEKGMHYVGVATGFVLDVDDGPVLYHAGDTTVFGDMQLIRELYQPRVAMLPIGGFYTMGPKEAALACRSWLQRQFFPSTSAHFRRSKARRMNWPLWSSPVFASCAGSPGKSTQRR